MVCYKYVNVCILLIFFGNISLGLFATPTSDPELIPREVLFGNPVKTRARLSPDGKLLAYLAPVDNVLNIWIKTIGLEDNRAVTKDKNRGIRYYFWAQD
ncbi:unnamed protein product [marine sediment metagenome]|uniref:Dipeptidylpeptidase IV N-terminal domain-containing protein n=1 Tax=marine sediment metagenome TaxID=412755 RepID=X1R138_9ZZZZ